MLISLVCPQEPKCNINTKAPQRVFILNGEPASRYFEKLLHNLLEAVDGEGLEFVKVIPTAMKKLCELPRDMGLRELFRPFADLPHRVAVVEVL